MSFSLGGIISAVNAVGSIISEPIKGWQKRKTAKADSKARIAEAVTTANIKKIEDGQAHEMIMEGKLLDEAGWKDEFWTIVISIPLIMAFVPGMDGYVYDGFNVLSDTPEWYRWIAGVVIGAPFGVRKAGDMMAGWKKK